MIAAESVVIAMIGAVLGVVLGLGLGIALAVALSPRQASLCDGFGGARSSK